jgi:hypothetical protein
MIRYSNNTSPAMASVYAAYNVKAQIEEGGVSPATVKAAIGKLGSANVAAGEKRGREGR